MTSLIATFVAVTSSSQAATVQTSSFSYGSHARQGLDAYWQQPTGNGRQAGLVIVHGGYWNAGDKADWASTAQWYAQQGLAVFSINHRFGTDAPWPAPRDDTIAAIEWIKSHASDFRLDPDRIAVLGSQAGGQLAVQAGLYGTGNALVRGVVGLSAISSPKRAYDDGQTSGAVFSQHKIRDHSVITANCTPATNEAACVTRYTDMGPTRHASAGDAPMFLIHSAGEIVPPSHGADVKTALAGAGVTDVTVRTVTGTVSGGGLFNDTTLRRQTLDWIRVRTRPRLFAPTQTPPVEPSAVRAPRTVTEQTTDDGAFTSRGGDTGRPQNSSRIGVTATGTRTEVTDVAYGTHTRQKLDAYYYKPTTRQPALVMVHGGYWYEGDKSSWATTARWFADRGYAVFAPNYRLNTQSRWSAQRFDVATVLDWVRANAASYQVDPARIVLLGSSAGGHIATDIGVYGTGTKYVKAVAALSPVANPYRAYTTGQTSTSTTRRKLRDTAVLLARCTPVKSDTACWNMWVSMVPMNRATTGDAPLYTVHSEKEILVPPVHSSELCTKLKAVKVSCTNTLAAGNGHAMSLLSVPGVQDNLFKWIQAHD